MRILTLLLGLAALGCALAIALAGPGSQMGWWTWGEGLSLIRKVSAPVEVGPVGVPPLFTVAALAGITGIASLFMSARGIGLFAIAAAVAAFAAGQVPLKMRADFEANPFIHDITTDFDNPPQIIAGADKERINPPEYVGGNLVPNSEKTVREAQEEAFPDLTPRKVNASLDETAEIVRVILSDMNMEMLDETLTDDGWLLEAAYTSKWFGFVDDFVVRLTPEGSMTIVNVRSKSRVGGSDLGANAARVRAFFEKLESATS
ncbi:DUF1499 domain-containing protein [Marinicaulis aureus]|uniref:DUF1499 domain-containing protein n=1 Tax=Hyphococcus aureus TaxID=2666033 RepID=A0ABW1KYB3_9PROT